ncbi:GNAT family N-acetyltransferase [Candidatus Gottesmanbacteria bacterium]|nr:GNAT family N-acetyltransferase [Candidatus Gottesmanbacteria bacterium]
MQIAPFTQKDHKKVADFWASIFAELGWTPNPRDGFDDIPAYFHLPEGFMLLVKQDGKIVGCGGIKPMTTTTGIIKRFYISPHHRGTGVAAKLLDKLIDQSQSRGFSRLVLDVSHTNTRAARFYEKHGFTKYAQEPVVGWEQTSSPDKFFYYQRDI